jgi:hypothetical protein
MRILSLAVAALTLVAPVLAQEVQGSFERTLTVSGSVDLTAMTDSGGIVVTPGASGSVQVRATLKSQRGGNYDRQDVENRIRELERNPPIKQQGNTVRIGEVAEGMLRGISMRLEIKTPPETRLRAEADSGGVQVSGIRGPIDVETDSGGITASDIGGDVRASADSGGIRLSNIQGAVFAQADSGGVEANGISGAVDVQTDSGGIRIVQVTPAPVKAQADSGGATIRLAANSGYNIRAMTDSGRLTVPDVTVKGTIARNRIEGTLRGGGPLVDVQVDSGNITIE